MMSYSVGTTSSSSLHPNRIMELAEKSGVGYTTISRFEQGKNANLTLGNFISLLRVAGLEERLMEVIPELPVAPLALREINKLIPQRVRRKDNAKKP